MSRGRHRFAASAKPPTTKQGGSRGPNAYGLIEEDANADENEDEEDEDLAMARMCPSEEVRT